MRYCEQTQRSEDMCYKPYILSFIPNCDSRIAHVLLAINLKQAVIHHEKLYSDNFSR